MVRPGAPTWQDQSVEGWEPFALVAGGGVIPFGVASSLRLNQRSQGVWLVGAWPHPVSPIPRSAKSTEWEHASRPIFVAFLGWPAFCSYAWHRLQAGNVGGTSR